VRNSSGTAESSTPFRTDELEALGYELWRAPEVEEVDGWRLRFAHGVSGRANSVWPNGAGTLPLGEKIGRAEEWYRERGAPVLFQLTDASQPAGLDDALAERGYQLRSAPVSVETARVDDIIARTHGVADLTQQLESAWLELWAGVRGFSNHEAARAILTDGHVVFARIGDVAVGRGVIVREWLGITAMVTLPEARRRGHAMAIVHALARWAAEHRCTHALIQVEATNAAARKLYAHAGFVPHHEYHYRLLP
jgi:GNAT superfamily N-acetyltransferase